MNPAGFVYVARQADGMIKIGRALRIVPRMRSLATEAGCPITLLLSVEAADRGLGERLALGRVSAPPVVGRERFRLNDSELTDLLDYMRGEEFRQIVGIPAPPSARPPVRWLYWTPEQVAAHLKMHPQTIRKALRTGDLRGSYFGHVWRIPEDALIEWLESKQNRPATKPKGKK